MSIFEVLSVRKGRELVHRSQEARCEKSNVRFCGWDVNLYILVLLLGLCMPLQRIRGTETLYVALTKLGLSSSRLYFSRHAAKAPCRYNSTHEAMVSGDELCRGS